MDAVRDRGGRDRAEHSPPTWRPWQTRAGSGQGTGHCAHQPLFHLLQKLVSLNLTKGQLNLGYRFRLLLLEWAPIKLHKRLWYPWGSVLTQEQYFYCRYALSLELQVLQPSTSVFPQRPWIFFWCSLCFQGRRGWLPDSQSLPRGRLTPGVTPGSCNWVFWGDQHIDTPCYWLWVQCHPWVTWQHGSRLIKPS